MMKSIVLCCLLYSIPSISLSQNTAHTSKEYKEDFEYFWKSIDDEYGYFNKKETDWQKVKELYLPMIDTVQSRAAFVGILEKALYEIYDHHSGLNTNTANSFRLVPTATDLWAEYINNKPTIVEVRKGSGAELNGLVTGAEVIAINDENVEDAVKKILPKTLKQPSVEAKNFCLRLLLAGNHIQSRKITLRHNGKTEDYYPDKQGLLLENIGYSTMIESKKIGTIGYIKINNCLFDNNLIPAFDSVMVAMKNTTGLIIDLRETPSGGNTSVAKAILGWFTEKEKFYQKHEYYYDEKTTGIKRSWEEIVSPRKGKSYTKPLVILCNHWTGSIAEGITIGFDALKRPNTITIGTEMARLCGAVYSYAMPNTKIHFSFPAERLYHTNGLPREQFVPKVLIKPGELSATKDVFIDKALLYLRKSRS